MFPKLKKASALNWKVKYQSVKVVLRLASDSRCFSTEICI